MSKMEEENVYTFALTSWYPAFKHLTGPIVIVGVPKRVLNRIRKRSHRTLLYRSFTKNFRSQLEDAITNFGHEAFVKDNWNAPTDAKFLSRNCLLKVTNIHKLFFYLTSSKLIVANFNIKEVDIFYITIRKWLPINPAAEFRCIVMKNKMIAIAPRDWPKFHFYYDENGQTIISKLNQYYISNIQNKFPKENYVFDVVLDIDNDVILLDFGPLDKRTNLYPFVWREIIDLSNDTKDFGPVFRFTKKDGIVFRQTNLYECINID